MSKIQFRLNQINEKRYYTDNYVNKYGSLICMLCGKECDPQYCYVDDSNRLHFHVCSEECINIIILKGGRID